MSDPAASSPEPGQAMFLTLLSDLVLGPEAPANLLSLSERQAFLSLPDGGLATVIWAMTTDEAGLVRYLRRLASGLKSGRLTIAVVGGNSTLQPWLRKLQPLVMLRRRIEVLHLNDAGHLWVGPRSQGGGWMAKALGRLALARTLEPNPHLRERLQAAVDPAGDRSHQLAAFARKLQLSRPWASYAMAGVCGAIFLLQALWGGTDFTPSLVRMGANVPALVFQGEWFRLASSVFLHGGPAHLGLNLLWLILLGGFCERLLGPWRTLTLYSLSGLAGGLASATLGHGGLSVGASGALFGVLGVFAALVLRPAGLLPEPLRVQLKRSTAINLGLALAVSLLPQVDLWAHAGGLAAGFVLVLSGLLIRGLVRVEERASAHGLDWKAAIIGLALSALMLAAVGQAFQTGKPWQLRGPVHWQRVAMTGTGLSLDMPHWVFLHPARSGTAEDGSAMRFQFGDFWTDPVFFEIDIRESSNGIEQTLESMQAGPPEGGHWAGAIRKRTIGGLDTLEGNLRYPSGFLGRQYRQLRRGLLIQLTTIMWPNTPEIIQASVMHVVSSIREDDNPS